MKDFLYITEKILDEPFATDPFKHIYIEELFTKEHLEMFTQSNQLKLKKFNSHKDLINGLKEADYNAIKFPGCTTSTAKYLKWLEQKNIDNFYNAGVVEGFGMAFKLNKIDSTQVNNLVDFLNSKYFHNTLRSKFNIERDTRVSTGIQKYLTGYEISPHPDIRSKALTYLININTETETEDMDIHTHLLEFKDNKKYIYTYWNENKNIDRCWVPWNWCDTKKLISKNNSLVMFAPDNDTLHAVKLDYNHLILQRTQLYGNLWYNKKSGVKSALYQDLPTSY